MVYPFSYYHKQNAVRVRKILCFWVLVTCLFLPSYAQVEPVEVTPSGLVQEVEGTPYFFHHVKQGQTLYSISRAYAVSQEVIISENPDVAFGLRYDQVIRIPVFFYEVAPQETEYGLSRKFDLTNQQLRAFNPDIASDGLKAGMTLAIPGYKTAVKEQETRTLQPEPYIYLPREPVERETLKEITPCEDASPKDAYKVALLIPLFLEDAAPYKREERMAADRDGAMPVDHKSFSFIPYYYGVLLALDSIRNQGVDITLRVYDVGQDMVKARSLILTSEFAELDLIIGPFFPNTLEYIADHARRLNIPVVSPLLADNSQLQGFPNLFQATPSLEAQLSNLAKYISRFYPGQNILLVHNNQPGALAMINSFKNALGREMFSAKYHSDSINLARVNGYFADETLIGGRLANVMVMGDSLVQRDQFRTGGQELLQNFPNFGEVIYNRTGMDGLVSRLKRDQKNIVITLIGGEAFLSNYLRELSLRSRSFDVTTFGIPEWQNYQSIEIDYLQDLNVHIFSPDFFDYEDAHIRDFVLKYRERFNMEPGAYAFKAAQTAYYFFSALQHFGSAFPNCMDQLNATGFNAPFRFTQPRGKANGWENQHATLFRYHDFRLLDVRRIPQGKTGEVTGGQ